MICLIIPLLSHYAKAAFEGISHKFPPLGLDETADIICRQAQVVQSGIISNALSDCEADILLVNNACNSLTCDRFIGTGIVESISASAFNTFTYGSIRNDDLSPSMTWAAHQILSDKRSVEEGITVAELHRRICLGTQWAASDHVPNWNGLDGNISKFYTPCMNRNSPFLSPLPSRPAALLQVTTRRVVG